MMRFRTIPAALAAALALASGAAAQDTSTTTGTAEISERGGIEATGDVIFQDILITPDLQLGPVLTTSEASANFTVTGDSAMVSLAVPASVNVTLAGSEETLTILTATDGGQTAVTGLGTLVSVGGILSVDVSGAVRVTPDQLSPGEYRGLLVVVAQYN